MADNDPILSAEVVLQPASGISLRGAVITSENISDFAASPHTIETTRHFFAAAGFDLGNVVGIGFAITARQSVFEHCFHVQIQSHPQGSAQVLDAAGGSSIELPLGALPLSLSRVLAAITFARPLDFGPSGNFSY